jgi:hypothetical protein
MLTLLAAMFLPTPVVRTYPVPETACVQQVLDSPIVVENACVFPLVIDTVYKNGLGSHHILEQWDTVTIVLSVPYKQFVCRQGQGVPSASDARVVHPSYAHPAVACVDEGISVVGGQ